ncbi:MAG: PEGA domain-containing protein [Planctomycetes bacterium]|nr:PEGA domain-containing protein [Planctomycetota bacterium]
MSNPLRCDRCAQPLESDDAISIIEGVCARCRGTAAVDASLPKPAPRRIVPPPFVPPLRGSTVHRPMNYIPPPSVSYTPPTSRPAPKHTPREPLPQPAAPFAAQPIGRRQPVIPGYNTPPEALTTSRLRRRRRDLLIGVTVGLIITVALTGYFINGRTDTVALHLPRGDASVPVTLTVKPAWASIVMDGKSVGPADAAGKVRLNLPNDGSTLKWLEVSAKGYHGIRQPLSAFGGIGDVNIELIQKPYELTVRTNPPDADVWINNQMKGRTPTTLSLLPGQKATLAVKRAGYEPITREIAPPVDAERISLDLALAVAGPSIHVDSEPPGAQLLVNGKPRGLTPIDLRLEPEWLGKPVQLTAELPGYDPTTTTVNIPSAPDAAVAPTKLTLAALSPRIAIVTEPPGSTVMIDGEEKGIAPLTVKLPAGRSGSTVIIEATHGAGRYGKQELKVPSPGQTARLSMALQASPTGVVFLLAPSADAGADHFALLGHINEQIHRLTGEQRFAVVVATESGPRVWPEEGGACDATSDRKIRAYDLVRSVRPANAGELAPALDAAMKFRPTIIWLATANAISGEQLDRMGAIAQGKGGAIHVVTTTPGADESELREWTAAHKGTLTVLGRSRPSRMAYDTKSDH